MREPRKHHPGGGASPRPPSGNPSAAVIRVANGYIVCENDRLIPTQICADWPSVAAALYQALHPDGPDPACAVPVPPSPPDTPEPPVSSAESPEWLTAPELARRLRVQLRTIRAWTKEGMPHLPVGRKIRYRVGECEMWLRARQAKKKQIRDRSNRLHPAGNQLRGEDDERPTGLSV